MGLEKNKWVERSSGETIAGTMEDIYQSSGGSLRKLYLDNDNDTNIVVRPDVGYENYLVNRKEKPNPNGTMDWEINVRTVFPDHRSRYFRWVSSMKGTRVMGRGVYVDDKGHGDATELHPLDLIAGRVTKSIHGRGDWISELAERHDLQNGVHMYAYRYAASGDSRGGIFLDGPPHDDETRTVSLQLPCPPKPGPNLVLNVQQRVEYVLGEVPNAVILGSTSGSALIDLQVTVVAKLGLVLGEVVAYWKKPEEPVPVRPQRQRRRPREIPGGGRTHEP